MSEESATPNPESKQHDIDPDQEAPTPDVAHSSGSAASAGPTPAATAASKRHPLRDYTVPVPQYQSTYTPLASSHPALSPTTLYSRPGATAARVNCLKCGAFLLNGVKFCGDCGEAAPSAHGGRKYLYDPYDPLDPINRKPSLAAQLQLDRERELPLRTRLWSQQSPLSTSPRLGLEPLDRDAELFGSSVLANLGRARVPPDAHSQFLTRNSPDTLTAIGLAEMLAQQKLAASPPAERPQLPASDLAELAGGLANGCLTTAVQLSIEASHKIHSKLLPWKELLRRFRTYDPDDLGCVSNSHVDVILREMEISFESSKLETLFAHFKAQKPVAHASASGFDYLSFIQALYPSARRESIEKTWTTDLQRKHNIGLACLELNAGANVDENLNMLSSELRLAPGALDSLKLKLELRAEHAKTIAELEALQAKEEQEEEATNNRILAKQHALEGELKWITDSLTMLTSQQDALTKEFATQQVDAGYRSHLRGVYQPTARPSHLQSLYVEQIAELSRRKEQVADELEREKTHIAAYNQRWLDDQSRRKAARTEQLEHLKKQFEHRERVIEQTGRDISPFELMSLGMNRDRERGRLFRY